MSTWLCFVGRSARRPRWPPDAVGGFTTRLRLVQVSPAASYAWRKNIAAVKRLLTHPPPRIRYLVYERVFPCLEGDHGFLRAIFCPAGKDDVAYGNGCCTDGVVTWRSRQPTAGTPMSRSMDSSAGAASSEQEPGPKPPPELRRLNLPVRRRSFFQEKYLMPSIRSKLPCTLSCPATRGIECYQTHALA